MLLPLNMMFCSKPILGSEWTSDIIVKTRIFSNYGFKIKNLISPKYLPGYLGGTRTHQLYPEGRIFLKIQDRANSMVNLLVFSISFQNKYLALLTC